MLQHVPQDPEAYVHRIGRTGRAGNAGTAITFITPQEYSKLMFIQRIAKTDIKKSKVPKVEDIINAKKKKVSDDLANILGNNIDEKFYDWSKTLLENNNPTVVLAAMLNYCFEKEVDPNSYKEITEIGKKGKRPDKLDMHGKARLFVALGKKDKITPRKLTGLIMGKVDIKPRDIGDVQVMDKFSFITVPFDKAEEIVLSFKDSGKKQLFTHADKVKKSGKKSYKKDFRNSKSKRKSNASSDRKTYRSKK